MSRRLAPLQTFPPRRFSRQWFLDGLRTVVWVAVITVLIWVYADIYFTKESSLSVTLRVHAESDDSLVLLTPSVVTIKLQVKGRRYDMERFDGARLSYDAGRGIPPGTGQEVDALDLLRRLPRVRRAGVEILSAQPKTLPIRLDRLVTIPDVPVRFEHAGGEPTDVKCDPDRIDLFVPATRAKEINRETLRIPTETVDLRDKSPGEPITLDVQLRPPDIPGCRLEHRSVRVTFTVGQQTTDKVFTVPLRVQLPKDWLLDNTLSQHKLLQKDPLEWTRKITVRGNRIDLDKLQAEDIEVYIVLPEDAKRPVLSWLTATVHVQFPKGLKLQADPGEEVSYRLVKQSGGSSP